MVLVLPFVSFLVFAHGVISAPSGHPKVTRTTMAEQTLGFFCACLPSQIRPAACSDLASTRIDVTKGVTTPLGTANGTQAINGVVRFAVKYATASRWQAPVAVESWIMPNNDPAALPLACPQSDLDSNEYSEDCLYVVLYVPAQAVLNESSASLNTLLWIHGGSFVTGAATNPGLDGSALALSTGSIVVTVQYRLGVLGFLPPSTLSAGINLGAKDVTQALTFLKSILPSFGGSSTAITVAGQSSGASMIRALLAAPTAASLFKNAILHSDPIYYNFLPLSAYKTLQTYFYSNISSCAPTATSCLQALPLSSILNAQDNLYSNAASIAAVAGAFEPLRPSVDGSFVTTSLTGSSFPATLKPLMITTVKDEGAAAVSGAFPDVLDNSYYQPIVENTYGDNRSEVLLASSYYSMSTLATQTPKDDQTRVLVTDLGTDATWRCASWTFARSWAARGGKIFAGKFMLGATYPFNDNYNMCTDSANPRVCHQDDIYITFGTTPSPTSAQTGLTTEVQARWGSFMKTSSPNPSSAYATWNAATTTNVHALQLGGSGEVADGACTPSFWGRAVLYDYQIYGVN